MGKPMGHYITLESEKLKENDADCHEKLIGLLAEQIRSLAKPKREDCILVIGLGNWNITPDALGPKVISKILVTRHLSGTLPVEIEKAVRPVAAVSPGVMGITGIETGESDKTGIPPLLHQSRRTPAQIPTAASVHCLQSNRDSAHHRKQNLSLCRRTAQTRTR